MTHMRGDSTPVSTECFIVNRSTPCFRGVGVKAWSGKEDTTLLSMVDRRVKQVTVFDSHQIWNKTPDSRVSTGERTHRESKHPILKKEVCHEVKERVLETCVEHRLQQGRTLYRVKAKRVQARGVALQP